jgi:hypothetical protein
MTECANPYPRLVEPETGLKRLVLEFPARPYSARILMRSEQDRRAA